MFCLNCDNAFAHMVLSWHSSLEGPGSAVNKNPPVAFQSMCGPTLSAVKLLTVSINEHLQQLNGRLFESE